MGGLEVGARLAVFDLDGTLTSLRLSPVHDAPLLLLPGVRAALERLAAGGTLLAVATNQTTGAFRGRTYTRRIVAERLDALVRLLPVLPRERVRVGWPGTPDWKPAPGLLLGLLRDTGTPPERTLFVGDAESDRLAAQAAGTAFAWAWDYFGWPGGPAGRSIDWAQRGEDLWRVG